MNVTIRKIGNSDGIIIPKDVLQSLGLKTGDQLRLKSEDGKIKLKPVDSEFNRQLDLAEQFMDRYEVTLKKLAE